MERSHELKSISQVRRQEGVVQADIEVQTAHSRDRDELARQGKKEVLKRNFGFMSMLGFSCTVMITWEGILVLFVTGLQNGGPAGLVYDYIVAWIGTLAVFTTMAELSSMAPTSSGQFHWVWLLAPPSSRKFLSYITGWVTVIGWQALSASGGIISATLIQGLIVLNNPNYTPQNWHGTLLYWAVILYAVFFNTIVSRLLPQVEGLILILHVLGFFAILVPLVYMAPHDSAANVFTVFLNEGGWPTQGLAFFVGLLGTVFSFLGADSAVHMSEEIRDASTVVPRTIILSIMINGVLGFGMLIAVLFCAGDLQAALASPTGYPFMEIFRAGVGSTAGSTIMVSIVVTMALCSTIGLVATSSRMYWSFARDRGLPCWRYLSRVDPRTSIPTIAVATTTTIACLLALINLGSTLAFNDVVSLTVSALYSSYFTCCSLLLWRRCTHSIALPQAHSPDDDNPGTAPISNTQHLVWGPWRVPGVAGILINAIGCVYLLIIIIFSFWPPVTPVVPSTMNYSVLMFGVTILFAVFWYVVGARGTYSGPVVEVVGEVEVKSVG